MLVRRAIVVAVATCGLALAVGCSDRGDDRSARPEYDRSARPEAGDVLRLGYRAVLTEVPALVGVETGLFAEFLAPEVRLRAEVTDTGPAAVERLRYPSRGSPAW